MATRLFSAIWLLAAVLVAQDTIPNGTYKGQWTGGSASGNIHMTFRTDGDPEVGFTLADQEVKCKILSFKPDGSKFKLVYEFDAQGTMLQSAIEGAVKGKTIEGTYKTTAGDQAVDAGTFKVTAP
jgi:hypothetical protein